MALTRHQLAGALERVTADDVTLTVRAFLAGDPPPEELASLGGLLYGVSHRLLGIPLPTTAAPAAEPAATAAQEG